MAGLWAETGPVVAVGAVEGADGAVVGGGVVATVVGAAPIGTVPTVELVVAGV